MLQQGCGGYKIQAEEMWTNGRSGERTTKRKSRHNGIKIASKKKGGGGERL